MKNIVKLLFVFLLGFMFIPMVHAADLPQTGVTYFMVYPNGEEVVTENYEEAVSLPEKLMFTMESDENGLVPLCDCMGGTVRVVQHVPNGYTTNQREMTLTLDGAPGTSTFVDYRGGNPVTGRSFVMLLVFAGVVGATILVSRKNKKALLVIPVMLLLGATYTVHAGKECHSVKITDGNGNPLKGVVVDVYGIPEVEAAPALKFDANGGYFFDGSETFYVRLPHDPCTLEELWDSFTDEEEAYYLDNIENAFRPGYEYGEMIYPPTLTNGGVAKVSWDEESSMEYMRINGNGGTYDFHGKDLEDVYLPVGEYPFDYIEAFKNGDTYLVGYDNNPACEHYTATGASNALKRIEEASMSVAGTIYLCWNPTPDGIYVNGVLFKGNPDTCYYESELEFNDGAMSFHNSYNAEGSFSLDVYGDEEEEDVRFFLQKYGSKLIAEESETIRDIKLYNNGKLQIQINENELEKVNGSYRITNDDKNEDMTLYMALLGVSCNSQIEAH